MKAIKRLSTEKPDFLTCRGLGNKPADLFYTNLSPLLVSCSARVDSQFAGLCSRRTPDSMELRGYHGPFGSAGKRFLSMRKWLFLPRPAIDTVLGEWSQLNFLDWVKIKMNTCHSSLTLRPNFFLPLSVRYRWRLLNEVCKSVVGPFIAFSLRRSNIIFIFIPQLKGDSWVLDKTFASLQKRLVFHHSPSHKQVMWRQTKHLESDKGTLLTV